VLLRNGGKLPFILGAAFSLVLAALAHFLTIDDSFRLFGTKITLSSTFQILGRKIVLTAADQPLLVFLFVSLFLWILFALMLWPHRLFPGTAFGFISLMLASFAVETMLYSVLLIELSLLFAIPILNPPGHQTGSGLKRMVIFLTLALPFFLIGDWLFEATGMNPSGSNLQIISLALIGFSFVLWLAIFPFHTWLPQLSEEANPISFGYVMSIFFTMLVLNVVKFINSSRMISETPEIFNAVLLIGAVSTLFIGIFAYFQQDLRRALAYIFCLQVGFSLISIGLNSEEGKLLLAASTLSRSVTWLLASVSLAAILRYDQSTKLGTIEPRRTPFAYFAFLISVISLVGYPLLASLPIKLEVLEQLALYSRNYVLMVVIGVAGFFLFATKLLFQIFRKLDGTWDVLEPHLERVVLGLATASLVIFGIFPAQTIRPFLQFMQLLSGRP